MGRKKAFMLRHPCLIKLYACLESSCICRGLVWLLGKLLVPMMFKLSHEQTNKISDIFNSAGNDYLESASNLFIE